MACIIEKSNNAYTSVSMVCRGKCLKENLEEEIKKRTGEEGLTLLLDLKLLFFTRLSTPGTVVAAGAMAFPGGLVVLMFPSPLLAVTVSIPDGL